MSNVQLVLRSNVNGLGKRGDVVEVSAGYARNYLEPRGLAIRATPGGSAQAEAMRRARLLKDSKDREASEEIARLLVSRTISVVSRAGSGGKLFGSVSNQEISQAISAQVGVDIDRRSIHIAEPIKTLGEYQVQVHLHGDVEFPLTVEVSGS